MVAFTKSIIFVALALFGSSAVMAQSEAPEWPDVVHSIDGAEAEGYSVNLKRDAQAAAPVSNGERLARGMSLRNPDRIYRPRADAPVASPRPKTAMSRTYKKQYCANSAGDSIQLGTPISNASVDEATNRCAARADGQGNNGLDSFAIGSSMNPQDPNEYLCLAPNTPPTPTAECTASNFAYYAVVMS